MNDNDLLDTYTELFVMDGPDGETLPHFECSVCDRDVTDDPCPDHAPLTPPPGLRLVECWSEPKHLIYVINRDDYGHPCPECRLIPHIEADREARQCRHWGWRRTRAVRRLVRWAYSLGVISGSCTSWGDGCDACVTVGRRAFSGRRPYVFGVSRDTWHCWLKGRHLRGDEVGFGLCGKCLPWSCCGSERYEHNPGCREADA